MATYRYEDKINEIETKFYSEKFISSKNKELVKEFLNEYGKLHLSKVSSYHKYYHLFKRLFREFLKKDLDKVSKKDMFDLIDKVKSSDVSERGKQDTFKILKTFYFSWYEEGHDVSELKEMFVFFKKFNYKPDQNKMAEPDVLTEEELKKLLDSCMNERDKAIIMTLWETGARVGELLSMTLRNVKEWDHGFKLEIPESKTQKRTLPVIKSAPYLATYIDNHPKRSQQSFPLFVSFEGEPMRYDALRMMLTKVAKRAGLKKKVYPHLFRHSRATDCANKGWNEFRMRKWFGWSMSSDTPSVYVRRSGIKLESEIAKENGIELNEDDKNTDMLKPKTCFVCKNPNPASQIYCKQCFRPLDSELIVEQEEKHKEDLEGVKKQIQGVEDKFEVMLQAIAKEKGVDLEKNIEVN